MDGIIYSGWLEEDSKHSIYRAKERGGLNRKRAVKMMDLARVRGITSEDCTWSLDKTFLESRTSDDVVAVAYNGFCFILDRDTMHCITMYHLPKHFGQKKTFYNEKSRRTVNYYESAFC